MQFWGIFTSTTCRFHSTPSTWHLKSPVYWFKDWHFKMKRINLYKQHRYQILQPVVLNLPACKQLHICRCLLPGKVSVHCDSVPDKRSTNVAICLVMAQKWWSCIYWTTNGNTAWNDELIIPTQDFTVYNCSCADRSHAQRRFVCITLCCSPQFSRCSHHYNSKN